MTNDVATIPDDLLDQINVGSIVLLDALSETKTIRSFGAQLIVIFSTPRFWE